MTDLPYERECWMPKPPPDPLDQNGVHDAVFDATRLALKLQSESSLQEITGETAAIWREINALRSVMRDVSFWVAISAFSLIAIAVKLWFFL